MRKTLNYNRYQRQITLPELGITGQKKLQNAKVLVVGAGGLGCPVLQYLAAAGVGTIGVVDGDTIDETNLHRQILYTNSDIGKYKSQNSTIKINDLNPDCCVVSYKLMIDVTNALSIVSEYDMVVDASDNYPTRYLLNDACVILKKPLIYGAVLQYEGQVGVFNLKDDETGVITNYRDLFPKPPHPSEVNSCNEAGVLGVLPGIIGSMQAAEVLKIITGIGKPLCNKVMMYNMKNNFFYDFEVLPNPNKGVFPHTATQFFAFDYDWFCAGEMVEDEISLEKFEAYLATEEIVVIDVREKSEEPPLEGFEYLAIPMTEWQTRKSEFITNKKVVIVCQSGNRSLKIVNQIKETHPTREIYSLHGGVLNWYKNKLVKV